MKNNIRKKGWILKKRHQSKFKQTYSYPNITRAPTYMTIELIQFPSYFCLLWICKINCASIQLLTRRFMEFGGSILYSQGLSNNHYPEPNQPNSTYFWSILILSSHLPLGLPKGFFPAGVPVKMLEVFLPSSILVTWPAHLNHQDLITLTILGERCKLFSSSLWSFLHSQFALSWAQTICK